MPITKVAIIGGGLAGLSLSLFLKQQGMSPTVYELRLAAAISPGAVMLSPNALRTLDALGVFEGIKTKGYRFRDLTFRNNEHKYLDAYEMGNADKYGYDCFRFHRRVLLDEMKAMIREAGVKVLYERKFSRIVSETDEDITFAFTDGQQQTVDLLIGADGIHSSVRKYLFPDVKPTFDGMMAVNANVSSATLKFPFEPYPMPVQIHGEGGVFVLAPQHPEATDLLIGIQYRIHDHDRAGWNALWNDKPQLLGMLKQNYDQFNPLVQSAMDAVPLDQLQIWAFHTVPKLDSWNSNRGRAVILGDAAHAIPPAAGQGVNQAFEDVHSLALLLAGINEGQADLLSALQHWEQYRQARVERVTDLTNEMTKRRMPGWTGEGAESIDSSWLFSVQVTDDVQAILSKL